MFELLRPHAVGRKAAIRATVLAAGLAFPATSAAAVRPHPINQTGKRPNPINQTGHRNIRMFPINQTRPQL